MLWGMVKEADLNRIDAPEDYEVLDATALGASRVLLHTETSSSRSEWVCFA